jgi:beta-phosphoglucomutase
MTIKAILFDMDGVLIEAKEWHYEALNRALSLFGMPISRTDHLSTFDGLPTRRKLELLSIERGLPEQLHEFINQLKQKYTMELIQTQCNPRFVHEYALSRLKHEGYKIAVCSNSIRATVEAMMQRANLSKYLDLSLSNEDVANGKPDPEIYEKAIKNFGLEPSECLIIEDNENGIKAALATGANLMVVTDTDDVNYQRIKEYINTSVD